MIRCEAAALHAPAHWQAEAANAVWSKFLEGELTPAQVAARVALLQEAPVRETPISALIVAAAEIATRCRVTVYDALYVALAVRRGAPLITADRKLCARLGETPEFAGVAIALDRLPAD